MVGDWGSLQSNRRVRGRMRSLGFRGLEYSRMIYWQSNRQADIWELVETRIDSASIRCDMLSISGGWEDDGVDIEVRSVGEFLSESNFGVMPHPGITGVQLEPLRGHCNDSLSLIYGKLDK